MHVENVICRGVSLGRQNIGRVFDSAQVDCSKGEKNFAKRVKSN
jgi:hypothetical protein